MFDFDNFINKPSMEIFGREITYRPKNQNFEPFKIDGDFHEAYIEINLKNAEADISSAKIVLFVRLCDFPAGYPKPKQGDYLEIQGVSYQIIDIEAHIPGSKKLVLHEE